MFSMTYRLAGPLLSPIFDDYDLSFLVRTFLEVPCHSVKTNQLVFGFMCAAEKINLLPPSGASWLAKLFRHEHVLPLQVVEPRLDPPVGPHEVVEDGAEPEASDQVLRHRQLGVQVRTNIAL